MKTSRFRLLSRGLFPAMAVIICLTPASAEVRTFVLDPGVSTLTLSGTALGIDLQEQDTGSLQTTYSGEILADVTETAITFVGGSAIAANNNGDWQPGLGGAAGVAPANYGAFADGGLLGSGYAALRNLLFDLESGPVAMLAGSFAADTLEFSFPENATATADYVYGGFIGSGSGSEPLAGRSTNNVLTAAQITTDGDQLVLTIPVDYTLVLTGDFDASFRVVGQLVARASNVAQLEIPGPEVSPGHLGFNIPTTPGRTYTILGSPDLTLPLDAWEVIDQFVASGTSEARDIAIELADRQFFILRED